MRPKYGPGILPLKSILKHRLRVVIVVTICILVIWRVARTDFSAVSSDRAQLVPANEWVAHHSQTLVFAEVGEQLSKAARHVDDIFELCVRHGRTCVLPRYHNGFVRLDGAVDFGDIYDLSTLPTGMSALSWRAFADNLFYIPSPTVMVCVFGKQIFSGHRLSAFERVFRFYSNNATFHVNEDCVFDEMAGLVNDTTAAQRHSDRMDDVLTRPATATYDIVAFFHFDYLDPIGPPRALGYLGYQGLDLSPNLYAAAIAFRDMYGDYIHLQWRMEKTDGSVIDFPACARAAVAHVKAASARLGVTNVYVSADVGRDGLPWSASFDHKRPVPSGASSALRTIYAAFPRVLTWEDIPAPRGRIYDLAVVGVLEKMIAEGSTYYVGGSHQCARGGSYASSISEWRARRRKDLHPRHPDFATNVQNAAAWWSLKDLNEARG